MGSASPLRASSAWSRAILSSSRIRRRNYSICKKAVARRRHMTIGTGKPRLATRFLPKPFRTVSDSALLVKYVSPHALPETLSVCNRFLYYWIDSEGNRHKASDPTFGDTWCRLRHNMHLQHGFAKRRKLNNG